MRKGRKHVDGNLDSCRRSAACGGHQKNLHVDVAQTMRQEILHSCKYCGRIHDEEHICSCKPTKRKKIDEAVRFRNSAVWHRKRQQIRERDCYLCQVCIRELYGTHRKYNYEGLQVHHAVPVNSSEELRLDSSNLITLCSKHHAMCDKGEIPYDEVKQIILEQEKIIGEHKIYPDIMLNITKT